MTANLGIDLRVLPFFSATDNSALDLVATDRLARSGKTKSELTDIARLEARENLAQALILRILTAKGSLAPLGHGQYGSRIHELIGEPKNQATRNLCRLFVLQCVAQEPRVENKAVSFSFDLARETPSSFYFDLAVQPVDSSEPLSLGLEVGL